MVAAARHAPRSRFLASMNREALRRGGTQGVPTHQKKKKAGKREADRVVACLHGRVPEVFLPCPKTGRSPLLLSFPVERNGRRSGQRRAMTSLQTHESALDHPVESQSAHPERERAAYRPLFSLPFLRLSFLLSSTPVVVPLSSAPPSPPRPAPEQRRPAELPFLVPMGEGGVEMAPCRPPCFPRLF